jgi:phage gp46-like protein
MADFVDILLRQDSEGVYDINVLDSGDLEGTDGFDTSIIMSIETDARASADEVSLPQLRRGSVTDIFYPDEQIGSKVWLTDQSRLTQSVLNDRKDAVIKSLEWMVTLGYATRIESSQVQFINQQAFISVTIVRPNGNVQTQLITLWENTANA